MFSFPKRNVLFARYLRFQTYEIYGIVVFKIKTLLLSFFKGEGHKRQYRICLAFKNDNTQSFLCLKNVRKQKNSKKSPELLTFLAGIKNDNTDHFLCLKTGNFSTGATFWHLFGL